MPKVTKVTHVADTATNAGEPEIAFQQPYIARVTIRGSADIMFHRWNDEAIQVKAGAPKNSDGKKWDNLESYIWRNDDNELCLPGEYLRMSVINAAKFRQDPRSPRKSAMDLFKAGVVALTPMASLGTDKWDYEDRRRAMVQRQGISRTRPVLRAGWECVHDMLVLVPEYIDSRVLYEVVATAGRLVGVADNRPTYGRFQIVNFDIAAA